MIRIHLWRMTGPMHVGVRQMVTIQRILFNELDVHVSGLYLVSTERATRPAIL